MRLIDADALIRKLFPYDVVDKNDYSINAKAVYNAIVESPTSDTTFKSDGEWKKVYDKYPRYRCTICSHLYNNREYKYCPFCGAKMKGGAE